MNEPLPFSCDLHCDLLSYLQEAPHPDPTKKEGIGSNFPALAEGNVKLQVMAIYTATQTGSTQLALGQAKMFQNLFEKYPALLNRATAAEAIRQLPKTHKLTCVAAIENASGFCEESEHLDAGFKKLEKLIEITQRILYIGLTHHGENRFGGGNTTHIGLKDDGRKLLDYLHDKKIALDFSHTCDKLADDMLNHISKYNLDIPLLASHSNFRKVFPHARNLTDDLAREIIKRKGLIGMNFLRAFLNDKDPQALYDHIQHGLELGGEHTICFGADYFYTDSHPDQSRKPFFNPEQADAACYPSILEKLTQRYSPEQVHKISNKNVLDFIQRIWS
ncbi:MAG: membrane dipeptidase [Bacteroidetes bacterium]|nr:membrane dipeptidase [Bacteroidota bacterium]